MKYLSTACAAGAFAVAAMVTQAQSAPIPLVDGGVYTLGYNTAYTFDQDFTSGGGLTFKFNLDPVPLTSSYQLTVNPAGGFADFEIVWSTDDTIDGGDIPIAVNTGSFVSQYLTSTPMYLLAKWSGVDQTFGTNLDIKLTAVPVPASLLLLLSGLLGLGFLGRRASKA